MKNKTRAKVPIIDAGDFGLNGKIVKIEISKKYMLAMRVNWKIRLNGAHVKIVYFVVLILFEILIYAGGAKAPNIIVVFLTSFTSSCSSSAYSGFSFC